MNIPTRLTQIIVTMAGLLAAMATFALAEIHPLKNVLILVLIYK